MIGCGPGQTCCGNCRSGFGEAPADVSNIAPRTTQVLYDYAISRLQTGQPFYISDDFNSDVLAQNNMGFFAAVFAAAAAVAAKVAVIAPKVAAVVSTAKAISNSSGGSKSSAASVSAQDIADAVTPQVKAALAAQGVTLPNDVANKAVSASLLDSFGAQNRPYVIAGLAGLGLLLVFKLAGR